MADIPEGSFSHTLEQIDAGVTEVENTKGQAASLTAAVTAIAEAEAATAAAAAAASAINDVFGISTKIEDNTDLNSLEIPGSYYREKSTNSSIGHIPIDGYAFKLTVEYLNSTSRRRQVFIPLISTAEFYIRIQNNNGWQPWRKFIDASDKFAAIQTDLPANNLYFTIDILKSYNTAGTWTGNAYERYGVTFEPQADGSVYVHGTSTSDAWFKLQDYGDNTTDYSGFNLSGCPSGGGSTTNYCLQFATAGNVREYDTGSGHIIETHDAGNVWILVRSGKTVDFTFYPMLAKTAYNQTTFIQGAPTNRQLYEMLLAIQNGANRSISSLSTQRGGEPEQSEER